MRFISDMTQGENEPSRDEKAELDVQADMVRQMMSTFEEYYSKRFNVERFGIENKFIRTMTGAKNRVRGLFRNLMRHRAI